MYLGGYASETEAARAYDKAALKYWGLNANLNFDRGDYGEFFHEIDGADAETYGIFPLNARRLRDCPYPKPYSSREGSVTSARTFCSHGATYSSREGSATTSARTFCSRGAIHATNTFRVNRARYVAHLRRSSTGFSRGASKYRGTAGWGRFQNSTATVNGPVRGYFPCTTGNAYHRTLW